jgi:hypothetical protein
VIKDNVRQAWLVPASLCRSSSPVALNKRQLRNDFTVPNNWESGRRSAAKLLTKDEARRDAYGYALADKGPRYARATSLSGLQKHRLGH